MEIKNLKVSNEDDDIMRGGKKINGNQTDHNLITFDMKTEGIKRDTGRKQIQITNKEFNRWRMNEIMSEFIDNPKENPVESYNRWLKMYQQGEQERKKTIWVKEAKKFKTTRNICAYKRNIKRQDEKIRNSRNEEQASKEKSERKKLKKELKDEINNQIVIEMEKEAKRVEIEGVKSNKFWKTTKKIKQANTKEPDIPYVIDTDNNDEVIHDKERGIKVQENFWTNLYQCWKMVKRYEDFYQHVKNNNSEERKNYRCTRRSPFSNIVIKKIIKKLKNNKAVGTDKISAEGLKMLDDENLTNLVQVLNRLYNNKMVPESWNDGRVTTIYKNKGKRGAPKNMRGITVTSVMAKLVEKLVYENFSLDMEISELQGGGK